METGSNGATAEEEAEEQADVTEEDILFGRDYITSIDRDDAVCKLSVQRQLISKRKHD